MSNKKGNPQLAQTRFKPGHAPCGGRPKGSPNLKTLFRSVLTDPDYLPEHIKDYLAKNKYLNLGVALFAEMVNIATNEDSKETDKIRAIEIIFDRAEGKPKQQIDSSINVVDPNIEGAREDARAILKMKEVKDRY